VQRLLLEVRLQHRGGGATVKAADLHRDRPAVRQDGLVAVRVGTVRLDGEAGEPLTNALLLLP